MLKKLIKQLSLMLCASFLIFMVAGPQPQLNPAVDIAPHVVPFKMGIMNNQTYATGFHVKFNKKVYILTNRHVCDFHVKTYRNNFIQFGDYVGEIIKIDELHDLCLVTSNRESGLELSESQGEALNKVYLVGFPRGMGKVIRDGYIIKKTEIFAPWLDNSVVETIFISTIAYGGNSGSPVTNEKGKVIGVLFAGSPVYHTETHIVPLTYVKGFLQTYAN